jgi:hypothetical protein
MSMRSRTAPQPCSVFDTATFPPHRGVSHDEGWHYFLPRLAEAVSAG